ncbi:MAG TPA: YbjN domain-containing protein [Acidimicrobiales bacterium]|nr:YbjN domain-containing protein [Acidimicrobiales bacterium]
MPEASLAAEAERASVTAAIADFAAQWRDTGHLLGTEHRVVTDRTATDRWVLRFRGTEKDVIAIWLTLGQRTVLAEAEVMPAPDVAADAVHELVLTRNASLYGLSYAIGQEHGIYLVARVAAAAIDVDELDRLCGAIVSELDEVYPTVMSLGFPAHYRRRRRS